MRLYWTYVERTTNETLMDIRGKDDKGDFTETLMDIRGKDDK